MTEPNFYWRHLRLPLILFALLATVLATSSADQAVAHALFYDEISSRWIGANNWWTNELIHAGGAMLIRSLAAGTLILWASTWVRPQWQELRRPALYFFLSLGLSVGVVGLLKALTNVDCPRDLSEFGGSFPFVHLFADRPEALRHARCFPAAHASSGYALVALYFALRERSRWASRLGLASGLVMGLIFGIAQQSRGAHFVSHDVWSAWLVWTISLSLYTFVFKARLWTSTSLHGSQREHNEASATARRLAVSGDADLPRRLGSVPGT
jgi:membrane-associated PAP2 superfamily phosphatase